MMDSGRWLQPSVKQQWLRQRGFWASLAVATVFVLLWTANTGSAPSNGRTDDDEHGRATASDMRQGFEEPTRKLVNINVDAPQPDRTCNYSTSLPKLVLVQEWLSQKQRPRESVTLMTHLSVDRLAMLENQCRTWRDPLAAVVYVPLFRAAYRSPPIIPTFRNTSLEDVIRGMDAFFYLMESTATCVMHVELVGQFLDPLNPEEYPINSLRNRALNMATTELTFMLDVDFVATPNLGLPEPGYRDPIVYNQMTEITAMKKALVLPAFEVFNRRQELHLGQNFARNLVLVGKSKLRELYRAGKVDAFNGQDAPWGHGPTNTSKWIGLTRPITYLARYEARYEPFVLTNRFVQPWADERFVGYGGNKIAYINQLHGLGFTFHVHPFGYVVHVPHVRTKAANVFMILKRRGESLMDYLRAEVESEVHKGLYVPHTVFCEVSRRNTTSLKSSSISTNMKVDDVT